MMVNEETFYKIIHDTWSSTLGFQVDRGTPAETSSLSEPTVCVRITGSWQGEVRLQCSHPLAQSIAAAIFQVAAAHARTDEILDALSELIHIVGGNLKPLLPQPVTLSLPSRLDLISSVQSTPQCKVVCRLALQSGGEPFAVTLVGDVPT